MAQNARILAVQAGPALLGCFMDWALLGVLTIQVYLYHVNVTCEPVFIQLLVYATFIVEILQTVNLTGLVWQVFVEDYGRLDALSTVHVGWLPLPIACSIVSLITQGFFAWRILMLSKSTRLVIVIVPLALMQVICGIFVGVKLQDGQSNAQFLSTRAALIVTSLWMAGSAFVDVLIAVIMTFQMVKWKTGIAATDRIINKIIRLVVETGSLTASVATVGLVLAIVAPNAAYYQPAIYVLTKLYSNTFLTNLTNRFFLGRDAGRLPRNQGSTEGMSFAFTSVFVDPEDPRSQDSPHAHGDGRSSVVGRIRRSLGGDRQVEPSPQCSPLAV
ncbi:hypothetical protein FOMPIDRAFT_1061518 [Fomitopsis schrenkii]|uniref:DUF6534 domain-containing protein n=1 Tax=Fomitopsis schrenkii TaxID=2126942 RepID=S8F9G7_FOMSC|nr:hypothetical protein FOMPIDRAFT_1061518 [Fomitopsis schrenkii]